MTKTSMRLVDRMCPSATTRSHAAKQRSFICGRKWIGSEVSRDRFYNHVPKVSLRSPWGLLEASSQSMQVCRKDRVLNVRIQCRGRTLTVKMPQGPDRKTASRFINEHLFLGECCEALSRTVSGQYPPGQNPLVPISPSSKICYVLIIWMK